MLKLLVGILALLYGLYSLYLRVRKDMKSFGKLDQMKERFGEKAGNIIHIVSYTILPILIGISIIVVYVVYG